MLADFESESPGIDGSGTPATVNLKSAWTSVRFLWSPLLEDLPGTPRTFNLKFLCLEFTEVPHCSGVSRLTRRAAETLNAV